MLVGVVSDTHNNLQNVRRLVELFNQEGVELVIHTGDISQPKTIECLSTLKSPLIGVFGNNDLDESGLEESIKRNGFSFQHPPLIKKIQGKKIAVFHEPDSIEEFLQKNKDIDLVLHGHTHRYFNEKIKGTRVFNPGECAGMMKGKNAVGLLKINDLSFERILF